MWFLIIIIICLGYVACGFVAGKVEAKCKKKDYAVDWNKILMWPKDVFGEAKTEDKVEEK